MTRNELIIKHLPLVRIIVFQMKRKFNWKIFDVEDLKAYGMIGLIQAVDRYDPSLGKFKTYASVRIYGAIFDGYRIMNWYGWPRRGPKSVKIECIESRKLNSKRLVDYRDDIDLHIDIKNALMSKLIDHEKEIIFRLFFEQEKLKDVAKDLRVSDTMIINRRDAALDIIKEVLNE